MPPHPRTLLTFLSALTLVLAVVLLSTPSHSLTAFQLDPISATTTGFTFGLYIDVAYFSDPNDHYDMMLNFEGLDLLPSNQIRIGNAVGDDNNNNHNNNNQTHRKTNNNNNNFYATNPTTRRPTNLAYISVWTTDYDTIDTNSVIMNYTVPVISPTTLNFTNISFPPRSRSTTLWGYGQYIHGVVEGMISNPDGVYISALVTSRKNTPKTMTVDRTRVKLNQPLAQSLSVTLVPQIHYPSGIGYEIFEYRLGDVNRSGIGDGEVSFISFYDQSPFNEGIFTFLNPHESSAGCTINNKSVVIRFSEYSRLNNTIMLDPDVFKVVGMGGDWVFRCSNLVLVRPYPFQQGVVEEFNQSSSSSSSLGSQQHGTPAPNDDHRRMISPKINHIKQQSQQPQTPFYFSALVAIGQKYYKNDFWSQHPGK